MEEACTFEEFIGLGLSTFNYFGWKSPKLDSKLRPIIYWICFCIVCNSAFLIWMFLVQNAGDDSTFLYQTHDFVSFFIQSSVIGRMHLLLFSSHSTLKNIFERLRLVFPTDLDDQKKFKIASIKRTLSIKNNFFLYIYVSNSLMFNLIPIFATLSRLLFGDGVYQLIMPFHYWFPFDHDKNIVRELCYAFVVVCNCINCAIALTSNILLVSVYTTLNMQFEILQQKFSEIDMKTKSEDLKKKIIALVEEHCELLSLSDLADKAFCATVLLNFIAASFIMCFVGIQLFVSSKITSVPSDICKLSLPE